MQCWGRWDRQTAARGYSLVGTLGPLCCLDVAQVLEQRIGHLHSHATEVGHKMRTRLVTCESTFCALDRVLATKWQHVTTVTTPVGRHVGVGLEAVWNTVVDFLLVSLAICIRL